MQRVSFDVTSLPPQDSATAPRVPRRQRPPSRASRFLILLVSVVLVGNALVGERGLIALIRATHQMSSVSRIIDSLRAENDGLREQVRSLREEPRAIEELARRELGLLEPGEKLFIIGDAREEWPELLADSDEPGEPGPGGGVEAR